jgi:transcriptional regulator with XRE-family HTH domain
LTNRGDKIDPIAFGKRLRLAFNEAKNAEIARKLGVSESAVSNYVAGRVPDADTLAKIKTITNCNLHWLLLGEGQQFSRPPEPPDLMGLLEGRLRQIVREEFEALRVTTVQELGSVDEPFDIAGAVEKYDNALLVLRDWYAHEHLTAELPEAMAFHGWETMSLEEKIHEVEGAKKIMDHNRYFKERRESSHRFKGSK